jgi:ATP-dependent Clp protease ATP-binding subunit ClpC
MFSPLSIEDMEQIVNLQMKEIQDRLNEYGVKVELTEGSRKWLAKTGYDKAFGARPLRRALQKFVESPLSIALLSGEIPTGSSITVHVKSDDTGLEFRAKGGKRQEVRQLERSEK